MANNTYPWTITSPYEFDVGHPADWSRHGMIDYASGIIHKPQQQRSKTWDLHPFSKIEGDYMVIQEMEPVNLDEVTQKYGTLDVHEHDGKRREMHMKAFDYGERLDKWDAQRMKDLDPEVEVVKTVQYATNREYDRQYFKSLFANVTVSHEKEGTQVEAFDVGVSRLLPGETEKKTVVGKTITVSSWDQLLKAVSEARTWHDTSGYEDEFMGGYFWLHPEIYNGMIITEEKVSSRDYGSGGIISAGELEQQFSYMPKKSNYIQKVDGYWECAVVMETSMRKSMGPEILFRAGVEVPQYKFDKVVYIKVMFGWMRTDITAVVKIRVPEAMGNIGISSARKTTQRNA